MLPVSLCARHFVAKNVYKNNLILKRISTKLKNHAPNIVRQFHLNNQKYSKQKDTTEINFPRLIYYSNPLKHAWAKINFHLLKATWDPEFNEKEFKKGAAKVSFFPHCGLKKINKSMVLPW